MSDFLSDLFPAEGSIPANAQLKEVIEQREYLINGELRRWTGDQNPVVSPAE
jgi:glyceraldehyde-3-phosphate dehydrogenase (NADP+)